MKTKLLIPILALFLLTFTTPFLFGESSDEYALGIVEWQYGYHPLIFNSGLIRIIDSDMNLDVGVMLLNHEIINFHIYLCLF